MNFRDHWTENSRGERFIFTVEMQRRLSEAGLPVEPDAIGQLDNRRSDNRRGDEPRSYEQRPNERETRSSEREAPRREQAESQPEIIGPETIQIDPMTGKYIGRIKW